MNKRNQTSVPNAVATETTLLLTRLREVERRIGLRLLGWSLFSVIAGAILVTGFAGPFAAGVGVQAIAWGVIDAVIAGLGLRGSNRGSADADLRRARLTKLLGINTLLDILYISAGVALWLIFPGNRFISGNGFGVIIQGAFLFGFDLIHMTAIRLRRSEMR